MDPTLQNPQIQQLLAQLSGGQGQVPPGGMTMQPQQPQPAMPATPTGAMADAGQQASLGNQQNAMMQGLMSPPPAPSMTPPPPAIY